MFRLIVSRPLSESVIARWTTSAEREQARGFAPARRAEWLSWRAVVRQEVTAATGCAVPEVRIVYNEVGAPVVMDTPIHLAVSHCRGSIAVAFSEAPCAVDIEPLDRDFERVASRYMTAGERALSADARWPAVAWCAKETLYKYAGRRELDLLHDLRIERVDFHAGTLMGRIAGGEPLTLRFLMFAGRVAVYIA